MHEVPQRVRETARLQCGIVSRSQAIAAGMPPGSVRSKLRTGCWLQVHRGVYATFTGPLPREAQLWAAVLYAGSGAVLSHESAGELQHLVDRPCGVIHVTVPASRRVTPVPGLVIHISDQPTRLDRYPAGQVPVTLVERGGRRGGALAA